MGISWVYSLREAPGWSHSKGRHETKWTTVTTPLRPQLLMSHLLPESIPILPLIKLDCGSYSIHLDDQRRGGLRQIAVPVVITDGAKCGVLIRASFNGTPGLTTILHPTQVSPLAPVYKYAMYLQRTALRTQSARVVVATEPVGVRCHPDGMLAVMLEMFDQSTGLCIVQLGCGSIFSPVARK